MRTTISQEEDRRGVACDDGRTLDEIAADARRIFADVTALIELRLEALKDLEAGTEDDVDEAKRLNKLMHEARQDWRTALELEAKAGARLTGVSLDLEAARAEIESRLDRLSPPADEDSVPRGSVAGDAGGDALSVGPVGAS